MEIIDRVTAVQRLLEAATVGRDTARTILQQLFPKVYLQQLTEVSEPSWLVRRNARQTWQQTAECYCRIMDILPIMQQPAFAENVLVSAVKNLFDAHKVCTNYKPGTLILDACKFSFF